MVAKRLARHADVIVDAGTVEAAHAAAGAAAAAAASGTVAAILKTHAAAPLYSISYKGGGAGRVALRTRSTPRWPAAPPPKTSLSRLRSTQRGAGPPGRRPTPARRRATPRPSPPPGARFHGDVRGRARGVRAPPGPGGCVAPDYTYDGEWAGAAAPTDKPTTSTFSYGTFRDGAFYGRGRWRRPGRAARGRI